MRVLRYNFNFYFEFSYSIMYIVMSLSKKYYLILPKIIETRILCIKYVEILRICINQEKCVELVILYKLKEM